MELSNVSIRILGTGSYSPSTVMTNEAISQRVDTSPEWIETRTGIKERRIAGAFEHTSTMATAAAREAISAAGIQPSEIDLLLVATITPDMPFPSTACLVQRDLGLGPIPCLDLEAACTGFLYALETASCMLRGGNYRTALIIGSEKLSSIIDWEDRSTCVLFGDGAGAFILQKGPPAHDGVIDNRLGADGENAPLLLMPGGGSRCPASHHSLQNRSHFLKMSGREIFKHAVRVMGNAAQEILKQNQLNPDQIDLVVPHQANLRIIDALVSRLGIPGERFFVNLDRYGNTSAASIPLAVDEAWRKGRIRPGMIILLVAFGAGLTWGASLLRWECPPPLPTFDSIS